MPWYRSGTVAITAGQTSVVGTNTDFAANARVGDAFQGPDGHWYEVANIASATVLSILPAYQGATVSAGGYGLAPMQGYVKDSADALRAIVNQYGNKLAALGTTGNYDILPVAKGGTGSASAEDARANLGLGTVATESTVPVGKGGTGATTPAAARTNLGLGTAATRSVGTGDGELMPRGAFGLGQQFSPGLTRISDASGSEIFSTGFYRYDANTANRPTFGSGYGSLIELSALNSGANYGGQIAVDYATSEMGFRSLMGPSSFSAWRKIYHDGNTTRAADGTLKAI